MRPILFHIVPKIPCTSLACLPDVLAMPLIEKTPVVDTLGIEYALEVRPTEGVVLLLIAGVLLRAMPYIVHWAREQGQRGE